MKGKGKGGLSDGKGCWRKKIEMCGQRKRT